MIGDIHGALPLLERLLQVIEQMEECPTVVCVGDYIDRGEYSAQVLELLMSLTARFPDLFYCLKGNHEQFLLEFLEKPEQAAERWLRHGGLQTLASYGIGAAREGARDRLRDVLVQSMGEDTIAWLHGLPSFWKSGNVAVVHAGADPARPIEEQPERALIWGHSDFTRHPRRDGIWVAHGHIVVKEPQKTMGRINVDTGAYATGILSAAYITKGKVTFLNQAGQVADP